MSSATSKFSSDIKHIIGICLVKNAAATTSSSWSWSWKLISSKLSFHSELPVKHVIGICPVQLAAACQAVVQLDQWCRSGARWWSWQKLRSQWQWQCSWRRSVKEDDDHDKNYDLSDNVNGAAFTHLQHRRRSEIQSRRPSCSWAGGQQPLTAFMIMIDHLHEKLLWSWVLW